MQVRCSTAASSDGNKFWALPGPFTPCRIKNLNHVPRCSLGFNLFDHATYEQLLLKMILKNSATLTKGITNTKYSHISFWYELLGIFSTISEVYARLSIPNATLASIHSRTRFPLRGCGTFWK